MQLISQRVAAPDLALPEIPLQLERLKLAKRRWRATAEDGAEFGVELAAPLADGDTLWQTPAARYVVRQSPEPLLE
ncbi:MAG TPA: urease accessory protein UreE, partial [Opitutaceae bacterium]|nr:urease accessory protein UreE [Opitutaceae bacterium]